MEKQFLFMTLPSGIAGVIGSRSSSLVDQEEVNKRKVVFVV
jgi:hypothetical protein